MFGIIQCVSRCFRYGDVGGLWLGFYGIRVRVLGVIWAGGVLRVLGLSNGWLVWFVRVILVGVCF